MTTINSTPVFYAARQGTGKAIIDVGGGADHGQSLALQPDGKIVVAGYSDGTSSDFSLIRLNTNGTLDNSFASGGKAIFDLGGSNDFGKSLLIQSDGKILMAGNSTNSNGTDRDLVFSRLNADGTPDLTFNGGSSIGIGINGEDYGGSIVAQPDGKVLMASDFNLLRLNADGTLDQSFNGYDLTIFDIGRAGVGLSLTLQKNGKILVAGYSYNDSTTSDFSLIRLNTDGTLDTTFSADGKATFDIGGSGDNGCSLTVQSDGKILLAGTSLNSSGSQDFSLIRLNTDGALDTTFSGDGKAAFDIGGFQDFVTSLTLQADGKILVAGYSYIKGSTSAFADFSLIRLNSNGKLDTTFSGDGKATFDLQGRTDMGYGVTVQPDGDILVAGYSETGTSSDFSVIRLNANGALDTTFGSLASGASEQGWSTLGEEVSYTERSVAITLDNRVAVYDAELGSLNNGMGNYSGASVTLEREGDALGEDVFSGRGNLSLANGNAVLSGIIVGTVKNAAGTLVIAFNGNATQARVNETLSSIGYANTSHKPASNVQIDWRFNDGNSTNTQGTGGSLSVMDSTTVNITAINDSPTGSVATSGNALLGQILSASNTLADLDGLGAIRYQWLSNGTAISGATSRTLALGAAQVGKAISVKAIYTDGQGNPESVTSAATAAVAVFVAPGVTFSNTAALTTTEGGGTATFQVVLNVLPRHDVVLTLSINDATEGKFKASGNTSTTMTFTAANWNKPQTVTLIGVDDKPNDGNMVFVVSTRASSEDMRYAGMGTNSSMPIANLSVTNIDNDVPDEWYGDAGGIVTADFYTGGNGASDLYGRDGRDELYGYNGNDRLYGSYGDDVLYGDADNDELEGDQGNDKLNGGTGDDNLKGGTGQDTLLGGDGNDMLNGGEDADSMNGGNGADTYYVDNTGDIISDSGTDTGKDTVYITAFLATGYTLGTGIDNAALEAQANNAALTGNTGNNTLTGNASNNALDGGAGADKMYGGLGNDTYYVRDNGDTVSEALNAGTDTVYSYLSAYTLGANIENARINTAATASLTGNALGNLLYAGTGNNVLDGATGTDTASYQYATAGVTVSLTKTIAQATGGSGSDTLKNVENLTGSNYADTLTGSTGNNTLNGGAGNDVLIGGLGADKLTGGTGADRFDFNFLTELGSATATATATWDTITDFKTSEADKIDLQGVDANTAQAGDQAFSYQGTAVFTGNATGKLRFDATAHILYGSTDADTAAEFAIVLTGVNSLAATGLVL